MKAEWLIGLSSWANNNGSVRELWLFGSRAGDLSRPDSDVDLAIYLMPASGKHDWAAGNYFACGDDWKSQLESIVGRHVSLEAIAPDTEPDAMIRRSGVLLWPRD